jgi:hypothetical protein
MTKTEAIRRIKSLPYMSARATGNGAEIRVSYRATAMTAKGREATAYYTDDPKDALASSMRMCLTLAERDNSTADEFEELIRNGTYPKGDVTSLRAKAVEAIDAVMKLANEGLTDIGFKGATILSFPFRKREG